MAQGRIGCVPLAMEVKVKPELSCPIEMEATSPRTYPRRESILDTVPFRHAEGMLLCC